MKCLAPALFLGMALALSLAVHVPLTRDSSVDQPAQTILSDSPPAALSIEVDRVEARLVSLRAAEDGSRSALPSSISAGSPTGGRVHARTGFWSNDAWHDGRTDRKTSSGLRIQSALVPILMYHHVRPIDFRLSDAFTSDLTLPPQEFERELKYLKERGFRSASMEELVRHLEGGSRLPIRTAIFTFDDGYRDNYLYAYPLLARYGFTGTFYVITNLLGKPDYMTLADVKEMAAAGMEIGSHTLSHPDLAAWLDPKQRERELGESKRLLQDALKLPVRALSYPSGSYNQQVVDVARRVGYTTAVTTRHGATHDSRRLLELQRVRIHGTDPLKLFQGRIEQYFPVDQPAFR